MIYEWYVDIFFLTNILLDVSAMLAAGVILNCPVRLGRCILTCALGVLLSIFFLLHMNMLWSSLLLHGAVHPLMTLLVFGGKDRVGYLRALLTVYLVIFVIGGVQNSMAVYFGSSTVQILFSGILAAVMFVIYLICRRVTGGICQVELWLQEQKITVKAYCDSGNLLRDPENGMPVSILQQEILTALQVEREALKTHCIGYRTIHENDGMLEVMTLDRMTIYHRGTVRQIMHPEVGLHKGEVMQRPKVQLLLNAVYF